MGVFFSFFQLKIVSKDSWVSSRGLPRRKLLKAFDSSYKKFKAGYFKVASREDELAFFLDKNVAIRFPLSREWNIGAYARRTS